MIWVGQRTSRSGECELNAVMQFHPLPQRSRGSNPSYARRLSALIIDGLYSRFPVSCHCLIVCSAKYSSTLPTFIQTLRFEVPQRGHTRRQQDVCMIISHFFLWWLIKASSVQPQHPGRCRNQTSSPGEYDDPTILPVFYYITEQKHHRSNFELIAVCNFKVDCVIQQHFSSLKEDPNRTRSKPQVVGRGTEYDDLCEDPRSFFSAQNVILLTRFVVLYLWFLPCWSPPDSTLSGKFSF